VHVFGDDAGDRDGLERLAADGDRPKTLDEIGRRYGVAHERIRQIARKGMRELRDPARARALADLLA
jgi:DNA-directed RNA polymerase sigma subunit (sigma70/sigma32)